MQKGFAAAMLDYFGKLPNQTNAQFLAELKQLDDADRAYFTALLEAVEVKQAA